MNLDKITNRIPVWLEDFENGDVEAMFPVEDLEGRCKAPLIAHELKSNRWTVALGPEQFKVYSGASNATGLDVEDWWGDGGFPISGYFSSRMLDSVPESEQGCCVFYELIPEDAVTAEDWRIELILTPDENRVVAWKLCWL